jgi:hypothetical protein
MLTELTNLGGGGRRSNLGELPSAVSLRLLGRHNPCCATTSVSGIPAGA